MTNAPLPKLLRAEFANFVPRERQQEIFDLISRLIEKLGSPEVAIDERHTPALHSRFLHSLLRKHRRDLAVSARVSDQQPPSQPPPQTATRGAPPQANNAFQPSPSSTSSSNAPFGSLGSAPGGSYESIAGSSPASFSDSSFTMPTSPAFDSEPAYTAVNGDGQGVYQFGQQQDDSWGPLLALQNPNYWKDMMMPGYGCFFIILSSELASAMCAHKSLFALRRFTWPESPQSMDTMPNGFDNAFNQYHMAAPIIG